MYVATMPIIGVSSPCDVFSISSIGIANHVMAIEVDPDSYVGSLLWLRPTYGWGWVRLDDPEQTIDYSAINQGGDFGVRVQSYFSFNGELR